MSSIESTVTAPATTKVGGIHPAAAPAIGFGIYLIAVVLGLALDASADTEAEQNFTDWAFTILIALVGLGVAWWASARAASRGTMARTSLILGVVAVVTIVGFWTGFPCVFGAAAIALGLGARQHPGAQGPAVAGILLGALALAFGAFIMVVG